tara:strand:- start:4146 stop:4403 length:258 start_codon:yes stop_codon:yes gene_type:complete
MSANGIEEPEVDQSSSSSSDNEESEPGTSSEFGGVPLVDIMQTFFTNENGDNVADVLTNIGQKLEKQLIAQNKVLVKLLGALSTK